MKKHNVVRFGYVAVTVFVGTLLFFACKNPTGVDVDNENSLTVGGQTYGLSQLYLEDWGWWSGGGYNTDIYLFSSNIDPEEEDFRDGTAAGATAGGVYLEMFFSDSSVSSGTYSLSSSRDAGTFSGSSFVGTAVNDGSGYYTEYYVQGGQVGISVNGSTYTINGDVTVNIGGNSQQATFNYTGSVTGRW